MHNGYMESFNGRMRDELLNETPFHGLDHARRTISRSVNDYNTERPHSSIGYFPPADYAATLIATGNRRSNPDQLSQSLVAQRAPGDVKPTDGGDETSVARQRPPNPCLCQSSTIVSQELHRLGAAFLETALGTHSGIKATKREDALREFISGRIPKRYGVAAGEVVDQFNVSGPQLDVLVFDQSLNFSYQRWRHPRSSCRSAPRPHRS